MPPLPPGPDRDQFEASVDALLGQAEAGGPHALEAARKAVALADGRDFGRAGRALAALARLDPSDAGAQLAQARRLAEAGDLAGARAAAENVRSTAASDIARARAAYLIGELARAQGDLAAARVGFTETLRLESALLTAAPSDPSAARWFARAKGQLADLDLAEGRPARAGAEGALAILQAAASQTGEGPAIAADIADAQIRLALMDLQRQGADEARRRLGQAIGRYEILAVTEPHEPHWRAQLAEAWTLDAEAAFLCGAQDQARGAMDKALTLRVKLANEDPEERWALAGMWRVRAALFAALGDGPSALQSQDQARGIVEALVGEAPQAFERIRFLHRVLIETADIGLRSGDLVRARDSAEEARRRIEPLARAGDQSWRGELAAAWDRLGEVARAAKAPAQAQDAFGRAVEFRRLDLEAGATDITEKRRLAGALTKLGDAALDADAPQSARAAFQESFALRVALAEASPGEAAPARDIAVALERLGLAAQAMRDTDGARAAWEEELALIDRIFEDDESAASESFRAVIEGHLAGLGGIDAAARRASALARLDVLAQRGQLSARDIALRGRLWKQTYA